MEPWKDRKRPWEDPDPIGPHVKRRDSTNVVFAASTSGQPSPLPQRTGYYSRGRPVLHQRRLPPPHISSLDTSAATTLSNSVQYAAPGQPPVPLANHRPRSQSLFNVLQHPHWQDDETYAAHPITSLRAPQLGLESPSNVAELHKPRSGTDPMPHETVVEACCPPSFKGEECSGARALIGTLNSELTLLERKVSTITQTEHHPSQELSRSEQVDLQLATQRALDLIRWSNVCLQEYIDGQGPGSPTILVQPEGSRKMRRSQHHLEEREEQSPPSRQYPTASLSYPTNTFSHTNPENSRRLSYHGQLSSMASSPHPTLSPPEPGFMTPQSHMQHPQPMRPAVLPSPSSFNFSNAPALPSISPPSAPGQTSAQTAHLQELQHQISVKTLALQTLQREYDSLLQKLERQQTKCATLEKKFEVSDVEINSLSDEKEKMQMQITTLETQVEELQESRDEARRQLVANGGQYMRIMEMANRLQGQSSEDKKKWDAEKNELETRIRVLEEAMVTGIEQTPSEAENLADDSPTAPLSNVASSPGASHVETINVLRAEVTRMRARTQVLEAALQTMRRESVSIQAAAKQLVESGVRLENVATGGVGTDG